MTSFLRALVAALVLIACPLARVTAETLHFTSNNSITIPEVGPASSYPWTIPVSGVEGDIEKVTVSFTNMQHTYSSDVDILLVSPNGIKVVLCAYAGGGTVITNVSITIDDDAGLDLPQSGSFVSGTAYRPTSYADDIWFFVAPAPADPYVTNLTYLAGSSANGVWSLYIVDSGSPNSGSIGGWSLAVTLSSSNRPPVFAAVNSQRVTEGNELVFEVSASDPADGESVTLTATNLPGDAQFFATNGVNASGTFVWTNASPAGVYTSKFFAADSDGTTTQDVVITVNPALPVEFDVQSIAVSGGNLIIGWEGTGGVVYALSRSTNLMITNGFAPVITNIAGVYPKTSITTTPSSASGFYRIEVNP